MKRDSKFPMPTPQGVPLAQDHWLTFLMVWNEEKLLCTAFLKFLTLKGILQKPQITLMLKYEAYFLLRTQNFPGNMRDSCLQFIRAASY
jgi:hypothetical protein